MTKMKDMALELDQQVKIIKEGKNTKSCVVCYEKRKK